MAGQSTIKKSSTALAVILAAALAVSCVVIAYRLYTFAYGPLQIPIVAQPTKQLANPGLSKYAGGPYAQSIMESNHRNVDVPEKRVFALMNERQLMINQSTPRQINPLLTLTDVNYRHSIKTIDYSYIVNERLDLTSIDDLEQSLSQRYCNAREYALMRELDVKVTWRYWSKNGMLLKTISSKACLAI